jgi:prepilin-type N-terminal cleavage/methylation domain-containing protein/prepilin-type processing-associated H-X9-DG protein
MGCLLREDLAMRREMAANVGVGESGTPHTMRGFGTGLRHALCRRIYRGFSLVELLVVLALITVLISLLMPALTRARQHALTVQCRSNLRQSYAFLLMYANDHHGHLFPYDFGTRVPREQRWPIYVYKPAVWNPPTLKCPTDPDGAEEHSYLLNAHLVDREIRYGTHNSVGPTYIILMGEKKSDKTDYYMQINEFDDIVEEYRHGLAEGSNYLFLDGHVDSCTPKAARTAIDPWDPAPAPPKEGPS